MTNEMYEKMYNEAPYVAELGEVNMFFQATLVRIPVKSATCPLQIGRLSGQIGHPIKRGWGVARGRP